MKYSTAKLWAAFFLCLNLVTLVAPVSAASNEGAEPWNGLIEEAWKCNPVFNEKGITYSIEAVKKERWKIKWLDSALTLECAEKMNFNSDQMTTIVEDFVNRYVHFDWTESGFFSDSKFSGTAEQFRFWLTESHNSITYKFSISDDFYSRKKAAGERLAKELEKERIDEEIRILEVAKKRDADVAEETAKAEARKRQAAGAVEATSESDARWLAYTARLAAEMIAAEEAETAKKAAEVAKKAAEAEALRIRRGKLLDGSIPVSNINDAIIKLEPYELLPIMQSPLLKPSNKFYAGKVQIEGAEGDNVIYAKVGGYTINFFGDHYIPLSYVMLHLTKKTKDFSRSGLRIGQDIDVVGRYVQNKPTFKGVGTMPVIEVMYFGN